MRRGLRLAVSAVGLAALLAPAARADDVRRAIDRGVEHLRKAQNDNGLWVYGGVGNYDLGSTSLAALTLLECGVPADDAAVQKAARLVREGSIGLTNTYSLALAIMFLDRLGDAADVPLIESMTVRLMAGQRPATGGWSYDCPLVGGEAEQRRLRNVLGGAGGLLKKDDPKEPREGRRNPKDLPSEIQQQIEQINRLPGVFAADGRAGFGGEDNSNTQFAILGLWVARRHGLPTERALALVDRRFRTSQGKDGGWGYNAGGGSSPAMTCAGLLGLAVYHGVSLDPDLQKDGKVKPADPNKDVNIKAAVLALGTCIGQPLGGRFDAARMPKLGGGHGHGRGYYFLWSLERVAVALNLDTIGNKDWYTWGSEIILANQNADGGWAGEYGQGGVDTCFALLFLKRANLTRDLTARLKDRFKDPGSRELRAGGVGGGGLQGIGLKPAFDKDAAKGEDSTQGKTTGRAPPASKAEPEVAKLSDELVLAPANKQEQALAKLRDSKGSVHTAALADAIPRLEGEVKKKAREALADRLTRMTSNTLRDMLQDDNLEMRRAAALAAAMKEDKAHVPRLIELLEDPELSVSRAAYAALKSLSGKDFGPPAEATRAERDKAVAAWRDWWKKQGGK